MLFAKLILLYEEFRVEIYVIRVLRGTHWSNKYLIRFHK